MLVYKKKSVISKKSRVFPFSKFTNSKLDDYSYIGLFAFVNNTSIGKYCSISMNFKSGLGMHPTKYLSSSPLFYTKKYALKESFGFKKNEDFKEYENIIIGNDVWIGADVLVMDGVKIGNGAIIGSKAVVVKDIPDYAIAVGVPAKVIKYRFSDEVISLLNQLKWWEWSKEKIILNKHIFNKDITLDILNKIVD
jgi:acetyltransferase-like isoleucine patch superfamily enzyme